MVLQRSWSSGLLSVAALALFMLLTPAAQATHGICCPHNHTGGANNANTCQASGGSCSNGPWPGVCADVIIPNSQYAYCSCFLDSTDEYGLLMVNALTALDGPPAQNTTRSYQTSTGPDSFGWLHALRGRARHCTLVSSVGVAGGGDQSLPAGMRCWADRGRGGAARPSGFGYDRHRPAASNRACAARYVARH